jgi:DNA-binding CsgD family transcriptional regulator
MDGHAGEALVKTVAAEDGRADPAFSAILERVVRRGETTPLTATRRELVRDDDWYASPHVKEIRKKAGIDDGVYSAQLLGARVVACVCLARPWWEKRRFDRGEREIVDLLHGQCAWVYREEIPPAEIEALPLSPREKQTLWKLLSGRGEKQIAAEMDLSRNTVHHYVKSLYKHFRVSSRAELLAKWMERKG